MNYTEVCQGWIYCITNMINGKKYIGQTIDFERRKREHFCGSVTWCPALHNAILKYGKENFEMVPIVNFTAVNRQVCVDVMNQLEIYYIRKYQSLTHQNGYNVNEGGGGTLGFHHSDKTKRIISEKLTGRKMTKEFGDAIRARHPEVALPDNRKAVLLYDLNGVLFRVYNSLKEARVAIGKDTPSAKANIRRALKDDMMQAYGYLWRYKESDFFPVFIEPYRDKRGQQVYHYTLQGELLGTYNSAGEASRQTGIALSAISGSLQSEREGRKRKSSYWSHVPPV